MVCLAALSVVTGCAAVPSAAPAPAPPTSAQAGATTIVAVAAPGPARMTLPEFLGLKGLAGGVRGIGQRVRNRLGSRFPGLESKPPLRSITDPANTSEESSPAVKAAAEAKAEEDKAPQKAKAIRYLASLGCGKCYPDTEDALLAALDDCNELIRFETVKGLRKSIGAACQCCRQNSCCSPKLTKKLQQMAYEKDDFGCFLEPSSRVRRYARIVGSACGCVPSDATDDDSPIEGPSSAEQLPEQPAESIPAPVEATEVTMNPRNASESKSDSPGSATINSLEPPKALASTANIAQRL